MFVILADLRPESDVIAYPKLPVRIMGFTPGSIPADVAMRRSTTWRRCAARLDMTVIYVADAVEVDKSSRRSSTFPDRVRTTLSVWIPGPVRRGRRARFDRCGRHSSAALMSR